MKYFIFSKKQKDLISEYEPNRKATVFNGLNDVEYTELNSTGKSNWGDAVIIGQFPKSAITTHQSRGK